MRWAGGEGAGPRNGARVRVFGRLAWSFLPRALSANAAKPPTRAMVPGLRCRCCRRGQTQDDLNRPYFGRGTGEVVALRNLLIFEPAVPRAAIDRQQTRVARLRMPADVHDAHESASGIARRLRDHGSPQWLVADRNMRMRPGFGRFASIWIRQIKLAAQVSDQLAKPVQLIF